MNFLEKIGLVIILLVLIPIVPLSFYGIYKALLFGVSIVVFLLRQMGRFLIPPLLPLTQFLTVDKSIQIARTLPDDYVPPVGFEEPANAMVAP